MLSAFFIDRPKFAFVIAIVIVLAGLLAIAALPIAEYPELTPPQVQVSATYPGATAQVAVYSDHLPAVAVIRRVMLRMMAWMNYVV